MPRGAGGTGGRDHGNQGGREDRQGLRRRRRGHGVKVLESGAPIRGVGETGMPPEGAFVNGPCASTSTLSDGKHRTACSSQTPMELLVTQTLRRHAKFAGAAASRPMGLSRPASRCRTCRDQSEMRGARCGNLSGRGLRRFLRANHQALVFGPDITPPQIIRPSNPH